MKKNLRKSTIVHIEFESQKVKNIRIGLRAIRHSLPRNAHLLYKKISLPNLTSKIKLHQAEISKSFRGRLILSPQSFLVWLNP